MKISILTLFKDVCESYINSSIIKRAINKNLIEIEIIDIRKFSENKHNKVDDYAFGGSPGIVMKLEPIVNAINSIKQTNSKIILTSPSGEQLTQSKLLNLSKEQHLIIIAGHYEGVDARISNFINETISIGDYVLTGGELAALIIADGVSRLVPNVINKESLANESFNQYLLDFPVYTRPADYKGLKVPEILLSGNHEKIKEYQREEQIRITKVKRPDLYQKFLERNKNEN